MSGRDHKRLRSEIRRIVEGVRTLSDLVTVAGDLLEDVSDKSEASELDAVLTDLEEVVGDVESDAKILLARVKALRAEGMLTWEFTGPSARRDMGSS